MIEIAELPKIPMATLLESSWAKLDNAKQAKCCTRASSFQAFIACITSWVFFTGVMTHPGITGDKTTCNWWWGPSWQVPRGEKPWISAGNLLLGSPDFLYPSLTCLPAYLPWKSHVLPLKIEAILLFGIFIKPSHGFSGEKLLLLSGRVSTA